MFIVYNIYIISIISYQNVVFVKNGIKRVYICVTMIGQVVLSFLNRNSHVFMIIDQSISEKNPEIFGYILDFFLKYQSISAILNKIFTLN
jgi:hypothetical protein